MGDPKKWIIDTNVIVHWLMANQIIQFSIKQFSLPSEFLDAYQNRYQQSISFVDKALEMPKNGHDFIIVELSLNELFSGVRDEVRSVLLFSKGIPISMWASRRDTKDTRFPKTLSKRIYELTSSGLDTLFFASNKIGIIPATSPSDEEDYLEVYSSLVFLHPELKTQDAILVTTGIFQRANYFVSSDQTLIKLSKEFPPDYGMEVISPGKASEILRMEKG